MMTNTSNIKVAIWVCLTALALFPMATLAGGGGGGGGSTTGPSIAINGVGVGLDTNGAVSNVSYSQGTFSGTFEGISVSFNYSSGRWEGTASYDGGGGGQGGGGTPTCYGCTYVPPPSTPQTPTDPTGLTRYCAADGSSVTLRWNPSTVSLNMEEKTNLFTLAGFQSLLSVRVAHAGGGGEVSSPDPVNYYDQNNGSTKPGYVSAPVTYSIIIGQNGSFDSPIYTNEISGTSITAPIAPDTTYPWRVRACRAGVCSSWQSSSFRCDPPPKLDLQATPSEVRYDNSSTLTWTSSWTASTCQAQFGWSGNKPNQNTSGESTGNLKTNTSYRLICPALYDFSPAIDDAQVRVVSCVAGAKASTSKNLVRKGEAVTLTYNTGAANPAQCVLKAGPVVLVSDLPDNGDQSASCSDGSVGADRTYTYEVNGEVDVTFECEGQLIDTLRIKVLPDFQET